MHEYIFCIFRIYMHSPLCWWAWSASRWSGRKSGSLGRPWPSALRLREVTWRWAAWGSEPRFESLTSDDFVAAGCLPQFSQPDMAQVRHGPGQLDWGVSRSRSAWRRRRAGAPPGRPTEVSWLPKNSLWRKLLVLYAKTAISWCGNRFSKFELEEITSGRYTINMRWPRLTISVLNFIRHQLCLPD